MPRRTRFGLAYPAALVQASSEQSARVEIFTPTRGLHRGDDPQDLAPGFTPNAYNFVLDAGGLTPRSALSQYKGGVSHLAGPALGAWRMTDTSANEYLVAASDRTVVAFDPVADSWSTLSYVRPSGWTLDELPSAGTHVPWDGAWIYDAASDANLAVLTNHEDGPFEARLATSVATYSSMTDFLSLASKARSVVAFDNRLVWFNCASSRSSFPTRVLWSARGNPRNYQLADGAGFEDLLDMNGVGTRIVAEREGVLLLTDEEIWRGRKRGDAYVFDFYPVSVQVGAPYQRTIVRTPLGVFFLGRDMELYAVVGDSVLALGPAQDGEASRVQSWLADEVYSPENAFALYNAQDRRYELYYTGADSVDGYPTRALYYTIPERSFLPQRFSHELASGVEYVDPGDPLTWDEATATWDEVSSSFDDLVSAGAGYAVHLFSSTGTAWRMSSTVTTDDGESVHALWTSHALNREDQMRYEQLNEVWLNYKAASPSTIALTAANDIEFFSTTSTEIGLSAGEAKRALATLHAIGTAPCFRLEITDGGRPRITRFQTTLVDGGLYDGGR